MKVHKSLLREERFHERLRKEFEKKDERERKQRERGERKRVQEDEKERKQAEKEEKKIKKETQKLIQGQATETRKRKMSTIEIDDSDDTQPKTSKSQRREHCEVCGQIPNEQNIWFVCKVRGNYCCSNCHDEDDFDGISILTKIANLAAKIK